MMAGPVAETSRPMCVPCHGVAAVTSHAERSGRSGPAGDTVRPGRVTQTTRCRPPVGDNLPATEDTHSALHRAAPSRIHWSGDGRGRPEIRITIGRETRVTSKYTLDLGLGGEMCRAE